MGTYPMIGIHEQDGAEPPRALPADWQEIRCPDCGGTDWMQMSEVIWHLPVRISTRAGSPGQVPEVDYTSLPGSFIDTDESESLGYYCVSCNENFPDIDEEDAQEHFEELAADQLAGPPVQEPQLPLE